MSDTVERAKNAVSDAVSEGVDAARERFEDVADDFDRRYKKAAKEARKVSTAAREKYDAAVDTLRDGYARARKDFNRISNDATDYVKENPGKSLLIAAGVGFLIGLAVRRGAIESLRNTAAVTEPGRDLERDLEDYEDALEREYRDYEAHLARVYEREGAVGRRSVEASAGGAGGGDGSLVDDFIDQLIPERVDWRRLVRDHPWPAVGLAAIGGYFLARSRGSAVIAALSGFAANAVADGVNEALGEDIL